MHTYLFYTIGVAATFCGQALSQDGASPELPVPIKVLCQQLREYRGAIELTLLDSKRDVLLEGRYAQEAKVLDTFNGWLSAVSQGQPPNYDDALAHFQRWSALPRANERAEASVTILTEYGYSQGRELCVLQFEDGRFQAELLTPDYTFGFQSSASRVRAAPRPEVVPSYFVNAATLLYPISLDPALENWFAHLVWDQEALAGGGTRVRARAERGAEQVLAATFPYQAVLPSVFMSATRIGPKLDEVAHTLTFFRHTLPHRSDKGGVGIYEALQFDTLAIQGLLSMRRMIVLDSAVGAEVTPSPLRLPVAFHSPRVMLKDMRTPELLRDYGADVTSWPQDVLDVLCPSNGGAGR